MKTEDPKGCAPCFPARHVLVVLFMCAFFTTQTAQLSLNIAIVAMVHPSVWGKSGLFGDDTCPRPSSGNTTSDSATGQFFWDANTQGLILGAMFYGSVITHVLGGRMAERWGGKWLFGGSMLLPALLCFLIPTAARLGPYYIFGVRVLQGLAEGVMAPSYFALLSVWAPESERNTMATFGLVGTLLGSAITMVMTGYISSHPSLGGWPSVFYLSGLLGCIWFLFWSSLVHSTPEEHPRITSKELSHIRESLNLENPPKECDPVPWRQVLTSAAFWCVLIFRTSTSWGFNTTNAAVPLYLETAIHLPVESNGLVMGLMYPASITGGLLGGLLADQLRRKTKFHITSIHKGFAVVGIGLSCVGWILIPQAECDILWIFVLLLGTKFFHNLCMGCVQVVLVDMAPQFAGTLSGVIYTTMDCTGFLSPLLTGFLTEDEVSLERWSYVFYVNSAILFSGLLAFLTFGSAERQEWAENIASEKTPLMGSPVTKRFEIPF